jgi:CubicO group peptidase (beta-lactamase class C family)
MKQFNRKPLFLALALTFAAPLAFAQSTYPQSSQPTQTQSTQEAAQEAKTQDEKAAAQDQKIAEEEAAAKGMTPATAASGATSPQKKNWADLDTDKNGSLSQTEVAPVQSLSKSFTAADANADGQLTQDEYKSYLSANGGAAKQPSH